MWSCSVYTNVIMTRSKVEYTLKYFTLYVMAIANMSIPTYKVARFLTWLSCWSEQPSFIASGSIWPLSLLECLINSPPLISLLSWKHSRSISPVIVFVPYYRCNPWWNSDFNYLLTSSNYEVPSSSFCDLRLLVAGAKDSNSGLVLEVSRISCSPIIWECFWHK